MSTTPYEPRSSMEGQLGNGRSLGTLFKQIREDFVTLIRQELRLARVEAMDTFKRAGRNLAFLTIGAFVVLTGAFILLVGISALVAWGLYAAGMALAVALWVGPVIVGVVLAAAGYILIRVGLAALRRQSVVPEQTVETLKEDAAWIRRKVA